MIRLASAEGAVDMPPNSSLPLESNADIMDGGVRLSRIQYSSFDRSVHRFKVSRSHCSVTLAVVYDKGCYLGQELTTRTHFTGV